jgi:hypothetical protein
MNGPPNIGFYQTAMILPAYSDVHLFAPHQSTSQRYSIVDTPHVHLWFSYPLYITSFQTSGR